MDNTNLQLFLIDNFPYALSNNLNCVYSEPDYQSAKQILEEEDVNDNERDLLYSSIACLFECNRNMRANVKNHTPTPLDDFLDQIPKEQRFVIDDPGPTARKLNKVIFGQDDPNFKKELELDKIKMLDHELNIFLTKVTGISIDRREIISHKIISKSFPDFNIQLSDIKAFKEQGREINMVVLDDKAKRSKIILTIFDSEKLNKAIKARCFQKDSTGSFYLNNSADIKQSVIVKMLEIDLEPIKDPIKYSVRVMFNLVSRIREVVFEFTDEMDAGIIEIDEKEVTRAIDRINNRLTADEIEMLSAYLNSDNYSKAEQLMNKRFSRYLIEKTVEKAFMIALQ